MPVDSIVSARHLTAIEKLGTRLDGCFTAEEAMAKGKLGGWNVRKEPLLADLGDRGFLPLNDRVALVRDNPDNRAQVDYLGVAGLNYQIVQNEAHAGFLNAIVQESGANFELAGATDGGRKVFISMKLPGHINVGGVDPVENSIVALNSHDGSMSFTLMVEPLRYACGNVMGLSYGRRTNIIRIRHTSGALTNLELKARQALDLSFDYLEEFQEQAERLINTSLTQSKFEEIITREFGVEEDASKAAITRSEKRIEELSGLFADSMTQEGIRETAWAGLNAMTEWFDHFSPTRGDDRENSRAAKALLDPTFKNRALELMMAVA